MRDSEEHDSNDPSQPVATSVDRFAAETIRLRPADPRSDAAAAVAPWNQSASAGWLGGGTPSGYNTPIAIPSQWSR